jgi:Flp pilus assembly protein TadG
MTTLYTSPVKSTARRDPGLRRRSGIGHPQSGQSLVEVALLLPFLSLLLLGVIEVGRYAYIAILVGNAARAGVGYGIQSNAQSVDQVGITLAAKNDFQNNGQNVNLLTIDAPVVVCGCDSAGTVTTAGCSATTNPTAGTCAAGHWVVTLTVTAHGTFNSLFNYPLIPASITVSRSAAMRVNILG